MPKPTQRKTEWKDQYTLLCESCGYILEDLDQSLPCPECGKPTTESLPHSRKGSQWQYRKSFRTLVRTWFQIIFHSKRFFTQLNANEDDAKTLMWRGILVASFCPIVPITLVIIANDLTHMYYVSGIVIIPLLLFISFAYWIIALFYAALAVPRLRFIASQQNYRLPTTSIWAVVGHASMGLAIAPLFLYFGFLIQLGTEFAQLSNGSALAIKLETTGSVISLSAIPLAVIEFEVLLFIGTRRLRYRNRRPKSLLPDTQPPTQKP